MQALRPSPKYYIPILIISALSLFVVIGCQKTEKTTEVNETKKEMETEVRIGATAFLTGKLANIGKSIQFGIEMAVSEINRADGINGKEIKLIIEDEGDTPQKGVSAVQKLINVDKVQIIIGPISSSSVMAAAPIANQAKVVLLSPGAASPNITNAGDYIFRNRAAGSLEAVEIAMYAYNKLGLRKISILEINEDYGPGFRTVFKETFESIGGTIQIVESYNLADSDFRTQLLKIAATESDGLYIIGVPNEIGLILRQAKELGIKKQILTNNVENRNLLEVAGDAAEGIYFPIPYFDVNASDSKTREFIKNYRSSYNSDPDLFAANGYDAVYIAKAAIENAGYSGEAIKKALYDFEKLQVVSGGTISFDENGDVRQKLAIKTVRDGSFIKVE